MGKWEKHEGDSTKVFYCAHCSLKDNIEVSKYLTHIVEYLKGLAILNKKSNWIFDHIFKKTWSEKEIQNMAIANVAAALITLNRLLQQFPNIENEVLKEFCIDLICDIEFWIIKIDPEQDFSWLIWNSNHSLSHSYYMGVRYALYGVDSKKFNTYDSRFINATLMIRNTIEQRIKGILGIDSINRSKGYIPLSEIIDVVCILKHLIPKNGIDLKKIGIINKWANHYLHRGIRPDPWQLEWAENEIGKMFVVGNTSDKKTYSIHSAFETENLILLRDEFETKMKEKYCDVQISWTSHGEIYERHRNL